MSRPPGREGGPPLQTLRYFNSILGPLQTLKLYAARAFGRRYVQLRVKSTPITVFCRPGASDRHVLGQVFAERECDIDVPWRPRLIVDGGANVGYSTLFFAHKYPDARIIGVEPEPGNLQMAERNCGGNSRINLVQAAIWPSDADVAIANPQDPSWSFRVSGDKPNGTSLRGVTIETLLREAGEEWIDILKLDIEGAEEDLFRGPELGWLDRVRAIVIECHGESAETVVQAAMENRGFAQSRQGEKLCFIRPWAATGA